MLQLRLPNIFKSIITQLLSLAVLLVMFVGGITNFNLGNSVNVSSASEYIYEITGCTTNNPSSGCKIKETRYTGCTAKDSQKSKDIYLCTDKKENDTTAGPQARQSIIHIAPPNGLDQIGRASCRERV